MLDYKLLAALAAVVEQAGFERAAQALGLSQSAVSQRIKLLEARVGQPVLVRALPPVPTEIGRRLLNHVQQVRLLERDIQAQVPGLDVSAGLVFSDETHAISAAVGAQGVALMSRQLIEDELKEGRLVQPFGPELEGKPFFLVYPEHRKNDPTIQAVRDWVMAVPGGLCTL